MVTEADGVARVVAVMEQTSVLAFGGTLRIEKIADGEGPIVQSPEFTAHVTRISGG
jgi:hypothetical protein